MSIRSLCEKCGQPALVHITGERGRQSEMRHLCLACAEQDDRMNPRQKGHRLDPGLVLITIGLPGLILSGLADVLRLGLQDECGFRQMIGIVIGLSVFVVGATTRKSTFMALGFWTTVLTLLANWIQLGRPPGFGSEQMIGCFSSLILLGFGFFLCHYKVADRT